MWSPLNTEPWCTIFCRLFDMAPHMGTFLILMKVSERCKKLCLPWPRRWAGPCYRMPRYYVHETIRLGLVLLFFYQIWFQFWFAIGLVLIIGYGYPEHRIKRNVIPLMMFVFGVTFYVVCWCGFFGRKQDGSFAAAQRGEPGSGNRMSNQAEEDNANNVDNASQGTDANSGNGQRMQNNVVDNVNRGIDVNHASQRMWNNNNNNVNDLNLTGRTSTGTVATRPKSAFPGLFRPSVFPGQDAINEHLAPAAPVEEPKRARVITSSPNLFANEFSSEDES